MLRNKIYDGLKSYLDRYLFGFDKNQLNLSILKGNINLKHVNIRPDEANKLIDGLMLPVTLKAGMIGNLQIKVQIDINEIGFKNNFSILSIWNNPVELIIDDLFMILGPNLSFVSHDESYIQDEELEASYDSTNVFNIFEHELQIKKKLKNVDKLSGQGQNQSDDNDEDSLKNNLHSFMKNLKLKVKRLHIRFEDDYFSGQTPFSLGIVVDQVELNTTDTEWTFDSLLHLNFFRVPPSNKEDMVRVILKELNLTNARVYLNSLSEMFIPTSLWDQTRHLENQIFDAMPVNVLNDLMIQQNTYFHFILIKSFRAFEDKARQTYLVSEFSLFGNIYSYKPLNNNKMQSILKVKLLFTQFDINLTPQMIDDLSRLYEFMQNFSISLDLKQYRPQRRPLVQRDEAYDGLNSEEYIKRKRRLIVRDWFFYVVWYVRLRKLLVNFYSEQLIEQEIEQNPEKYKDLMKAAENGRDSIKQYLNQQNKLQNKNKDQNPAEDPQKRYQESQLLLKFQNINFRIYESYEKYRTKNIIPESSFEIVMDTLVYENTAKHNQNTLNKQILAKELKFYQTQMKNKEVVQKQVESSHHQGSHANIPKEGGGSREGHNMPQLENRRVLSGNLSNFLHNKPKQMNEVTQQTTLNSQRQQNNISSITNIIDSRKNTNIRQPPSNYQQYDKSYQSQTNNNPREQKLQSPSQNEESSFLSMFGIKNAVSSFFGGLSNNNNGPQQSSQQSQNNGPSSFNQFDTNNQNQTRTQNNNNNTSKPATHNEYQSNYQDNANNNNSYYNKYTTPSNTNSNYNNNRNQGVNSRQDELEAILNMGPNLNSSRKTSLYADNPPSYNKRNAALTTSQQSSSNKLVPNRFGGQQQSRNMTPNQLQNQYSQQNQSQQQRPNWLEQSFDIISSQKGTIDKFISKTQFCNIKGSQVSQQSEAAIMISTKTNIVTPINGLNRKIEYKVNIGSLELEYSNDVLKNLCDTMLEYKQLHVFRYVPLKNLFQGRQNIHRKIELHAPLYLIKKLFITDPQNRNSLIKEPQPSNNQNPFVDNIIQNRKIIDVEEDENISDEDDNDIRFKRKNIQTAVSLKDPFKMSHKFSSTKENAKFKQLLKDQNQQQSALQQMTTEHDTLLLQTIISYEQKWNLYDLLVNVDLSNINIYILPSTNSPYSKDNTTSTLGGSLCKLRIQQQEIQIYKQKDESGFNAFGLQFQSINRFQMYFYFVKSMQSAVETYTKSPLFHQSSQEYFDKFRQIFRQNFKIKKTDDRETIKNILGAQNTGDINQVKGKDDGMGLQLFNKEGVDLQQKLLNKGKTGVKSQAHYNYIFNNLEDNNSSSQHTSRNEIVNIAQNMGSKPAKNNKPKGATGNHIDRSANKDDMQPHKVKSNNDDMSVHLVMSSEGDDDDEESKTPIAQFGGGSGIYNDGIKFAGENKMPHMMNNNISLSQATSPSGFLANYSRTQFFGNQVHPNPMQKPSGATSKNHKITTADSNKNPQQKVSGQDFSNSMQNVQQLLQRGKSQDQNNSTKNFNVQSNKASNGGNTKKNILKDMHSSDEDTLLQERDQEELFIHSTNKYVQPTALAKTKSTNYESKQYKNIVKTSLPNKRFN